MDWMIRIGLIELAAGGLLGWGMVVMVEKPEWLEQVGIVAPHRIRQVHLDYIFMGLILIAVGLAVPSLCDWIAYPLVFGTIVNPFLFVPPAFEPKVQEWLPYRVLSVLSFIGVSGGLLATAIVGPG